MITSDLLEQMSQRAKNSQWSKNSFNCSKCPKEGCPAWLKHKQNLQNTITKQIVEKEIEGCSFVLLPIIITDSVLINYQTYDAVCQKSNELDQTFKSGIVALKRMAEIRQIKTIESGEL